MFDRLPPFSADAEACVLGSILLDREAWEGCTGLLTADSFHDSANAIVWRVTDELFRARKPVDAVMVRAELLRLGKLDEVGGTTYLASLLDVVPSSAHGAHYAAIVAEKAKLRGLIRECGRATEAAYKLESAEDIAARLESAAAAIRMTGRATTIRELGAVAADVMREKREGRLPTIRTGLSDLDDFAGGLLIGGVNMVAGKPGMGKSALCKQFAYNIGGGLVRNQPAYSVGIISIEESAAKIATNYLSQFARIVNDKLVYNRLDSGELDRGDAAAGELAAFGIFIDDAHCRLSDIQRAARTMVKKHGCQVVIVDHLHLVDGETDAHREQELSRISGGLKSTWKELGVCGVEALQMNRGGERECLPELDHLRGSGSLEADGDVIMQLYRADYFGWKKAQAEGTHYHADHRLTVFLNKNKNGPVGKIDLHFDGDCQTIRDTPDAFR